MEKIIGFFKKIGTGFKKTFEWLKKVNYKKTFRFSVFLAYTLVVVLITYAVINTFFKPEPKKIYVQPDVVTQETLEVEVLEQTLEENAQLVTAQLKFKANADYKDTGIPGINKNDFTVLCDATVKAGIDMTKVNVSVDNDNKIVDIKIPSAEINADDIHIDHNTLKFYDKKFVLFPVDVQEDTAKALALADNIAKNYAYETGIIEMANKQSEAIIKGILSNVVPRGYKMNTEIIGE